MEKLQILAVAAFLLLPGMLKAEDPAKPAEPAPAASATAPSAPQVTPAKSSMGGQRAHRRRGAHHHTAAQPSSNMNKTEAK